MVRIILYLKFSVYRICELASRLIALVSIFNNFQGDMFNIYILSCILRVSFLLSEEKNYQLEMLSNKAQLSNQQPMGLVTRDD